MFDCFSFSKKNTLRGLHFQTRKSQAKIITVVQGKILDVVVDLRKNLKLLENLFRLKFLRIQIFHFLYLKILHMDFFVYQKIVPFITSVPITEIKKVKLRSNGMMPFSI